MNFYVKNDPKVIDLLARCIDSILSAISPDYPLIYDLGAVPKTLPATQDYITKYLFNRIDEEMIHRIMSDQILKTLITEEPRDIHFGPINHSRRRSRSLSSTSYLFAKDFTHIGEKYKSDLKQINDFLLGKTDQWWTKLSKAWITKIGKAIYKVHFGTQRYKDRMNWCSLCDEHSLVNEDIQSHIVTFL
jgi:hypothetical protein